MTYIKALNDSVRNGNIEVRNYGNYNSKNLTKKKKHLKY